MAVVVDSVAAVVTSSNVPSCAASSANQKTSFFSSFKISGPFLLTKSIVFF